MPKEGREHKEETFILFDPNSQFGLLRVEQVSEHQPLADSIEKEKFPRR